MNAHVTSQSNTKVSLRTTAIYTEQEFRSALRTEVCFLPNHLTSRHFIPKTTPRTKWTYFYKNATADLSIPSEYH